MYKLFMNGYSTVLLLLLTVCSSCKKFVEIEPPIDQVVRNTIFSDDGGAISAINGIYSAMINNADVFSSGGSNSFTNKSGLLSDELINYANNLDNVQLYTNQILPTNGIVYSRFWSQPYKFIYYANSILEGLANSTKVTPETKKQLEGEAKFIRAFYHFYLVNLFGDIPLVLTTDYKINKTANRTATAQVYEKVIEDLLNAQNNLPSDYLFSKGERVRINKWAATAMLARVYLYLGNWVNAEVQSSALINNTNLYSLRNNLNEVFLRNSTESIWQLLPIDPSINTFEGNTFIITTSPVPVSLTPGLLNSFEAGDNRKVNWINSFTSGTDTYYYPYKYKVRIGPTKTEYSMVLRLAEQYLVRGEARAQQNKLTGANSAESDINFIRNRAGLGNTTATTKTQLLLAIEQERRVEFFTEWGHRWLDLTRTKRADAVLGPIKSNWQPTDILLPIPKSEIDNNPNLNQNPGY